MEENKEVEQEKGQDNGKANEQADEQEVDNEKPMIQKKTLADRIPPNEMRNLLSEYYYSDKTLLGYLKSKNLTGRYKTFKKHWDDSGLSDSKQNSHDLADALPKYDKWCEKSKEHIKERNRKNASCQKLLPPSFETFMQIFLKDMALIGKGLGRKTVRSLIKNCLKEYKISDKTSAFCEKTLENYLHKYDLQCKNVKNICPHRISQVTPANRTMMFANLDSIVGLVHEMDPTNCPWKSWEEVPARFKYNMDEMSTDPTNHRNKIVLSKNTMEQLMQCTPQGKVKNLQVLFCFVLL